MLVNISEDFMEKRRIINDEVGKPFPLDDRRKLGGTFLKDLPVTAASIDIYNLLILNGQTSTCNLEMRPKGIIISFRAGVGTYSLVIPYYKLKVYKGRPEEYSFYKDHYFIKIQADKDEPEVHQFIRKINHYKTDTRSTRIEDL